MNFEKQQENKASKKRTSIKKQLDVRKYAFEEAIPWRNQNSLEERKTQAMQDHRNRTSRSEVRKMESENDEEIRLQPCPLPTCTHGLAVTEE